MLKPSVEASTEEKQLYGIKKAVIGLIEFVTTSLEQLGVDKLNEIVDPSLDELEVIIIELDKEASNYDDLNLRQALLLSRILISDIRQKNPEICAEGSRMLRRAQIL
ncbi:hypothetical protein GPY51_21485 [Photorhabdus laumondii subsp. laumondii]|uniref:Uncharacterized protein n=2 Tax=Morganellaceae TaxID=1903414 RepID=A0A6L9JUC8_PHOLM|nr:hypothetical protein [Photorhabdus laumondii]MCC8384976.1 hypothetical protein [Photorhabdus laumondii]MCC8413682.1 hypothetical protein [Photorhabdus laumondii]NDK96844.1 hypothetical protein [Photorhabdus laumondii subsp. laumondii]NDL23040.1 hypothetical protein [Photorhabdus laumondii subsp. laumondii]NDL32039.1 hypothetical protein [Photorhabdus laumondii subsp. laumondii]